MTEQEWEQCSDPEPMLIYLRGKATDRKLRLFACACCRRIWHLLPEESRNLIEILERRADGQSNSAELSIALRENDAFFREATSRTVRRAATSAASDAAGTGTWAAAWKTASEVRRTVRRINASQVYVEERTQAALLREIFHDPMRSDPVLHPSILAWQSALVARIASVMYEEREFNDLPILGDALEEAGCTDEEMLAHCRGPGPHVRGCSVNDVILEKS